MTRCRCAECGNILAYRLNDEADAIEVVPCGACLQEAAADAIACYEADREPMIDESRD